MSLLAATGAAHADSTGPANAVVVSVSSAQKITTIQPWLALGSTVDKEPAGSIPALYSRQNIRAMLDAGLGWLSYRLFTELSDQDWHWNPQGTFSAGTAGYWTSSGSAASPTITDSFGYRLPHRGNTTDQGNNESYSRLDDGDPKTYWKSDPYLDSSFTGDPDRMHAQWVVVDLGKPQTVNEVRISWANPYATAYALASWTGDDPINDPATGTWSTIGTQTRTALGSASDPAQGPVDTLSVEVPVNLRYLRVLMWQSSKTCDSHGGSDKRNCVGYTINELSVGFRDSAGAFHDFVHHLPCGGANPGRQSCGDRQTATYVSSVDPWHGAADRVRNQEQPGLDLIARSGLTHGAPAMYPVAMLYSTPDNAVAEIRYLRSRHYPISLIELGEEPDGQYTTPEDDATLYLQWARAIHKVYPDIKLGGPVFSGVNSDLQTWPDADGNVSWLNRFLNYLRAHSALDQLAFMSFEHYPFNGCEHGAALQLDLLQEPSIIKGMVNAWRSDGLPPSVPMYITEANFTAVNFTQTPMLVDGALWQADYMASSLTNGIMGVVYYQYEPVPLSQNAQCPSDWGNLTMFVAGEHGDIHARGAQFHASRMLTRVWLGPPRSTDDLFIASTDARKAGYPLITAYAVRRASGEWSVLLVNKDDQPHAVDVRFESSGGSRRFDGSVKMTTFGDAQYVWRSLGRKSRPDPDGGPVTTVVDASRAQEGSQPLCSIPARSMAVLTGSIAQNVATTALRVTRKAP